MAFCARRLEDNVVNNALAIASFVSGILLGLFLLGILTRRVGQSAALAGVLAGLVAVSFAKFQTPSPGPGLPWLVRSPCLPWGWLRACSARSTANPASRSSSIREAIGFAVRLTTMALEDHLLTESRNPRSESIDTLTPLEFVRLMNSEDAKVVAAVGAEAESIARAIEWAADRLGRGGRLIYVGAGTSGRLGVLDAAECPPTFSTPPGMVVGLIAGGPPRDSGGRGSRGRSRPWSRRHAALGVAKTISLSASPHRGGRLTFSGPWRGPAAGRGDCRRSVQSSQPARREVDLEIAPLVGPEIISGSTRLKGGTATKMILNMISTGAMVRIGKTLGNRMVDLQPSNEKLRIRSRRILRDLAGVDDNLAAQICRGRRPPEAALVVALTGVDPDAAQALLEPRWPGSRGGQGGGGREPP